MEDTITSEANKPDPNQELKTRFANLLINRVALSECLNVIRDACMLRANDILEQAKDDETAMANILKDIETFENPPKNDDATEPAAPTGSSVDTEEVTPVTDAGPEA